MCLVTTRGGYRLDCCDLGTFLDTLVHGTNLHISVVFVGNSGSGKMSRGYHHIVHKKPICLYLRKGQNGLATCMRCRMTVQNYVARHNKPLCGYCTKGVYEYCSPVVYQGKVIAVTFIGNILTGEKRQFDLLGDGIPQTLLDSMEKKYTHDDCVKTAAVVAGYIRLLADRYGLEEEDHDDLIEGVKGYIRENFSYDISGAELAGIFGYNAKYLGRLFKSRAGITVTEYCNQLRIAEAKRLLEDTDMRITDIALQVGFNNITYFNYVFSKQTALSPGEYRTRQRRGDM